MRQCVLVFVLILSLIVVPTLGGTAKVTHREFQAINAVGESTFIQSGVQEVQLEGILLNAPEQWVDPTPNPTVAPFQMGGEWEIFIQGEGDDHAGTACWMGQNYGNLPWVDDSYTNEAWLNEIAWLNRDPNTGYIFRPGDRVRVTGRFLFYAGKLNINEQHSISSANDFSIELVKPAAGLPQPEAVTLMDLKDDEDRPLFDPQRLRGPEYFQMRLVRIEGVTVLDPENWGPNKDLTIADATGRTFPVYLCLGLGFSLYPCPTGRIDVVGIMDQKSTDGTQGYRLLVFDHDGNDLVLGTLTTQRGNLLGDLNSDYRVDESDRVLLEANLNRHVPGLTP